MRSAIVGDNIGYLLGRKLGREVLTAPGPFSSGASSVIAPATDSSTATAQGGVPRALDRARPVRRGVAGRDQPHAFKLFFFWNALGGITWGLTFGLVGYFGGQAAANVLAEAGVIGGSSSSCC